MIAKVIATWKMITIGRWTVVFYIMWNKRIKKWSWCFLTVFYLPKEQFAPKGALGGRVIYLYYKQQGSAGAKISQYF